MIAGVSGQLISGAFLASQLSAREPPAGAARAIGSALSAAGRATGPASSVRALLHSAAMPLAIALGFSASSDVVERPFGIVATLGDPPRPLAFVVTRFGDRLGPLWREAAIAARERGADWALLYNGVALRLVDATRMHARRHLEFDLDESATAEGVAALWLTLASTALGSDGPLSTRSLVAASDRHAVGVCRSLRDGVLDASTDVLDALTRGRRRSEAALHGSFEQALTIVYRLLFLLFAEARGLVPLWHPVYRESYSVEALRDAAERSTVTPGMWEAVRAMTRLAHAGCRAGDLRVTPFNGRLFAPSRTPLAERRDLDDRKARTAVLALATRPGVHGGARDRITYRDLGVEQLGAVYERLLDYEPAIQSGRIALRPDAGVRKATGTFYTPQPIADYLVRRTLSPLVRGRSAEQILQLRILDPSMGSGAFLVAACGYLADAYETALVERGTVLPHEIDDGDRALFRRRVAERCLYGVDLNPMAVQLARLSLWLATLAADRPLTFLDHRLMSGNSLIGVPLSRLRHAPRRRSPALPAPTLFDEGDVADALRDALPVRFSLETTPTDTLAQVRAKESAHAAASGRASAMWRWRQIADAWCAAWFSSRVPPAAFTAMADRLLHGSSALPSRAVDAYLEAAAEAAREHGFFHWELECPEVFFDEAGARLANGGFDAVIGNPPWNIVHVDSAAFLRFTRDAGTYQAHGHGHANRYQLFVERAVTLTRRGGRIGLVLPWGFAVDHGSAPLRRFVMNRTDVDAMVAVDNHRGVFPIHRSVRFALLSATGGRPTREIACAFGVDDPAALESLDEERPDVPAVRLTPSVVRRISGDGLAIPYVRTPLDLAVAERAAALFPPLRAAEGWGASFGRELNATDDRALFRTGGRGWPVIDGKHVTPFSVDLTSTERWIAPSDARRALGDRCEQSRLAYRDVASATNRVTLIAALLPPACASTHTLFCLRTRMSRRLQHLLCGLFNSLVVNFLVRLTVTTHVTTAIVEQLPIPSWRHAPGAARDIAALARVLRRGPNVDAYARLNALAARWYQLTEEEFARVLDTFPLIEETERSRAMEMFLKLPGRR